MCHASSSPISSPSTCFAPRERALLRGQLHSAPSSALDRSRRRARRQGRGSTAPAEPRATAMCLRRVAWLACSSRGSTSSLALRSSTTSRRLDCFRRPPTRGCASSAAPPCWWSLTPTTRGATRSSDRVRRAMCASTCEDALHAAASDAVAAAARARASARAGLRGGRCCKWWAMLWSSSQRARSASSLRWTPTQWCCRTCCCAFSGSSTPLSRRRSRSTSAWRRAGPPPRPCAMRRAAQAMGSRSAR
mmetsp:Transcript_40356/g.94184  ORF Transcript_40356/g.94184 Transcript_40356/m.94184 type:complete len:248 (+) Transcript_40356:465-1208(+)